MFSPMHGISETSSPELGTTEPLCLSTAEVAEKLRVSERYVFTLIARDELVSFRSGKRRLIRMSDLCAYIDRLVEEDRVLRQSLTAV